MAIKPLLIIVLSVVVVATIVTYLLVPDRVTAALTAQPGSDPGASSSQLQPVVTTDGQAQDGGPVVVYGSVDAQGGLTLTDITVTITPTSASGQVTTFSLPHAGNYRVSTTLPTGDYSVQVHVLVDGKAVDQDAALAVGSSGPYEISLLVSASSPLFFFIPIPSY